MGGGAETLFLAAFLAGVAEGSSVLKNYYYCYSDQSSSPSSSPNRNGNKSHSSYSASSSLLIPSVIYGGLAFPMSLIGESPGPELLAACMPSVRKMLVPLLDQNPPNNNNSSRRNNKKVVSAVPILHNKDHYSPPSTQDDSVTNNEASSKTMIGLARKANRGQKTTITQQSNLWSSSPVNSSNHPSKSSSSSSWSRYAATLDSRYSTVLPTPKAELLRRVRLILFGAGLVSTYMTHHLIARSTSSNNEEDKHALSKNSSNPLDRFIHSVKTTSKSENNNNRGEGVTLRLMYDDVTIRNSGSINSQLLAANRRIPTLLSSAASSPSLKSTLSLLRSSVPVLCLNIEDLEQYSDQTWLHHYSCDNQQNKNCTNTFWLIEIDLSPPLKDMFRFPSSSMSHNKNEKEGDIIKDPSFVLDEFRLVMDYIDMMTTSSRYNPKNDNSPDVIATAIYSSSNDDKHTSIPTKYEELGGNKKIVYVDISKELANKIDQTLCPMYPVPQKEGNCNDDDKNESTKNDATVPTATLKPTNKKSGGNMTDQMPTEESTAALRNDTNNGNIDPESEDTGEDTKAKDVFQWIGLRIRRAVATLVSSRTSAERALPLHVVSDNPDFVSWVVECLPNYCVIWTDPNDGTIKRQHRHKQMYQQEEKEGIPYLICCSTDEKSSRIIQQILAAKDDEQTTKALVVMEGIWTKNVTRQRVNKISPNNNNNTIEIISMETLRMDTFKHMQMLLEFGEV